jgi:hypothetical protein
MEMTPEMWKEYMRLLVENERLRRSTNERQAIWAAYLKTLKVEETKGRTETSFNMNKF